MISTSPEPLRCLVADVMQEHARAVAKFPGPNVNMTALVEETGELVDALAGYLLGLTSAQGRLARVLLHFRPDDGGDSTWADVRKEAVQVAVMAMRVALEGDSTLATPDGRDALQTPSQDDVAPAATVDAVQQLLDVTADVLAFLDPVRRGAWENRSWIQDRAGELQAALELSRVMARRTAVTATTDVGSHDWRPAARGGRICARCSEYRPADLQPGDVVAYHTVSYNGAPPRRKPMHYRPDEVCHGPRSEANDPVDEGDLSQGTFGDQTTVNRSHVAMDRFPRRGEVLTLRVVHWRQGVERMSGGDLYHLERLDENTGKWRETNPPLDWSCGSMADLLANVTAWTKDRGVEIVWHNMVYVSETPFGARPHNTMDTAPGAGVAIRIDGELFTDKQIRAMVDQVRDFMRNPPTIDAAGVAPGDELAATPAQLEPGTVIISGVTHERRFTATHEPGWEHYHLVVNDGETIVDGTLAQVLQTIGLLPSDELDEPAMKVTTPRGLCRIEGDKATSWKVEQFDGRAWVTIAGDVSLQIAQGVYNRRMKEQFPVDEVLKKTGEEITKIVSADFKQSIDKARGVLNTVREAILENGVDQTPAWEKAYDGIDALLSTPNFY